MRNIPIPAGCTLFGNSSRATGLPDDLRKAQRLLRLCRPPGVRARDRFRGVLGGQNLVRANQEAPAQTPMTMTEAKQASRICEVFTDAERDRLVDKDLGEPVERRPHRTTEIHKP